jgi:hypothetical protein
MAAPKNPKSIKSRIDELVSKLGELPAPSPAFIKGKLVALGILVEALEEGAVIRDAEAKIEILEAELGNLKIELSTLQSEVEAFRAERKKQKEEERKKDLPEAQFKILQRLGTKHSGDWLRIDEVAQAVGIRLDEAEIHFEQLEKAGFTASHYNEPAGILWHRTAEGNRLVVAKRWAGEEDQEAARKYPDLPPIQHEALLMMVGEDEGINEREIEKRLGKSLALTQHNLSLLRDADMATDGEEGDYGTGRTWVLLRKGEEYLAERNLL